jgi:hypothetical protein
MTNSRKKEKKCKHDWQLFAIVSFNLGSTNAYADSIFSLGGCKNYCIFGR